MNTESLDHPARARARAAAPADDVISPAPTASPDRINWVGTIPVWIVHLLPLLAIFTGVPWQSWVLLAVTYTGEVDLPRIVTEVRRTATLVSTRLRGPRGVTP